MPYYRQLLPVFNIFKNHKINVGDKIVYNQRKRLVLGDLIQETLVRGDSGKPFSKQQSH